MFGTIVIVLTACLAAVSAFLLFDSWTTFGIIIHYILYLHLFDIYLAIDQVARGFIIFF